MLQEVTKFRNKKDNIFVSKISEIGNLKLVRVHIPGITQPDERLERIGKRLHEFKKKEN